MAGVDLKRLVQIMGMTGSNGDGEALNAIRMANAMLKSANLSWSDVLRPPVLHVPSQDFRTPPSKRGTGDTSRYGRRASQRMPDDGKKHNGSDIDAMMSALASRRHEVSTMMFLASLRDFWERNSYLTTPQYDALKQMHSSGDIGGGGTRSGRWQW